MGKILRIKKLTTLSELIIAIVLLGGILGAVYYFAPGLRVGEAKVLDGINVDMWGNVYRADCQFGGALGNLERYKLPEEEIVCDKSVCSCLSDIYIRKESCE